MKKKLKRAFIPHKENNYKPTLFHFVSISAILMIGITIFIGSVAANRYVLTTGQGAAVYSSVLVDLTNKARTDNNEEQLVVSETLTKAAQMKADDMAARQYFSHTSPDGTTPWYWFQKAGYDFTYAGENLAIDFTESSDIEKAWLASPKHKENIVDSRFTEIGIATKTAQWQGRETTFVVQLFGKPSRAIAAEPQRVVPLQSEPASSAISTPTVAGATTSSAVTVLAEDQTTVVAENPKNVLMTTGLGAQSAESAQSTQGPTLLQKAIVRFPNISTFALTGIAVILLLGLILFVFVEIKRLHPRHVIVGIFVFFVITSLAYFGHTLVLPL